MPRRHTETAAACKCDRASASEISQRQEHHPPPREPMHFCMTQKTPVTPMLQKQEVLPCIYFKAAGLCLRLRRRDRGWVRYIHNSSRLGLVNTPNPPRQTEEVFKKASCFMKHFQASEESCDIKACLIIMLSRGERQFTSIRVKCVALWRGPDGFYLVS